MLELYGARILGCCTPPPPCVGSITGLKIYDQVTDAPAAGVPMLTNGVTIDLGDLPDNYYIAAEINGDLTSVDLTLDGQSQGCENDQPYTWPNGAENNVNWNGGIGTFTLNVKAYVQDDCQGQICDQETVTFTIDCEDGLECPPDITIECNDSNDPIYTGEPTFDCDPNAVITHMDESTQGNDPDDCDFYNYTITRTWTATVNGGPGSCTPTTLVRYSGTCNDGPDSFDPTIFGSCVKSATDLVPIGGNRNASCQDDIICIETSENPGWEFTITSQGDLSFTGITGIFYYPIGDTGTGNDGNSSSCPSTFSFTANFYLNGNLQQSVTESIQGNQYDLVEINLSTPIDADNNDKIKVEILGNPTSSSCDLIELKELEFMGCCGSGTGSCNEDLVEYSGECNDGPDSFDPTIFGSCVKTATELVPIDGKDNASCQDDIICIETSENPGWEFSITSDGALNFTGIVADLLFPSSGNSSSCGSFSFTVDFYLNGNLQHSTTESIPKGQTVSKVINLPTPIVANFNDIIKVEILGNPTSSSCDLLELTKLRVKGCCGDPNPPTETFTCEQEITVEDTEKPELTCPSDVTIECDESTDPSNTGSPTNVSDNCDPDPEVTKTEVSTKGNDTDECDFYDYTITRTWRVEDACGNFNTCVQKITVKDTEKPELTCPSDVTIECDESTDPSNTGDLTGVSDNCDPDPEVVGGGATTQGNDPDNCDFYNYTITRFWRVEDACGNFNECVQVITVKDTEKPELTCPSDVTIECDESTEPSNTGIPTNVSDNCDLSPDVTKTDESTQTNNGSCTDNQFTITRTWRVEDACGNFNTCKQIITVEDTTNPETCEPDDKTIECLGESDNENAAEDWNDDNIQKLEDCSSDVCGDITVTSDFDYTNLNPDCGETGTLLVIYTITDDCGNSVP